MAEEYKYQYKRTDLTDVVKAVKFIDLLKDHNHLINKGYLEPPFPSIQQDNFEVIYNDKNKAKLVGNVSPQVLFYLLIEIQKILTTNASASSPVVYLPPVKNSPDWNKFYFQGVYDNPDNKTIHEEIIEVLHQVAHGSLKKKDKEPGEDNQAENISELSLSFRQGNLIENWTKPGGVKKFAQALRALTAKTPIISGKDFGKPDEYYSIIHALGALSVFHEEFKFFLRKHKNYDHPDKSNEKKAISKLEEKSSPFFAGRGIVGSVLVLGSDEPGKLDTDNDPLDEYIKLFDEALKALKKAVPEITAGGSDDEDVDGGSEEDDPDKKKDQKDLISFEDLYTLIRDSLVSFIYDTYYKKGVETDNLTDKYEIRLLLLGIISNRIDSTINLRVLIREELNSNWQVHVDDAEINRSKELDTDIEIFVEKQASSDSFDFESVINEDIDQVINNLSGITTPGSDHNLTKIDFSSTANIIVHRLIEEKVFAEGFTGDDWEKLSSKDRVSYWKRLTLSERRAFLEKNHLMDYVDQYSTDISIKYLEEQLARNSISLSERSKFSRLLNEMRSKIAEDLISIPPTEFGDDTEIFLAKQEGQGFFLRMEQRWITEFTPSLEKEIADFALHNPQFISHEFIQDKSFNEIASSINENLSGNAGEDRIDEAAGLILDQILNNIGLPRGVKLEGLDRAQSVREIEVYLRLYLKKNDIDYIYFLYSDTSLDLFVNRYSTKLIGEKGAFFLPLVEERIHLVHRQIIFKKIQQQFGIGTNAQNTINFENTLYSIITEAALSKINPEDYIDKLSAENLGNLFGLSATGITLSQENYELLRELILKYVKARKKGLYFKNPQEVDSEEFTDGALFLREQSRGLRKQGGGGKIIYTVITYEPPSGEEEQALIKAETELETLVREDHLRQKVMALAIWEAYSEEERQFLAIQEAQNLAIYQQQQILDQQAVVDSGEKKPKNKKKGLLKKGVDKLKNKGVSTAATATSAAALNAILPGSGAIAGLINALPIPDKYKKYLTTGLLGGIVALAGAVIYMVTHSVLSALGGIVGLWFGGPLGFIAGATIGYGLEMGIKGFFGDVGSWISNTASNFGNWVGNGLNNIFGGGSSSVAQARATIPQAGIGQVPGINTSGVTAGSGTSFGLGGLSSTYVAAVSVVATTGILFVGGNMVSNGLHSAFLQRIPESIAFDQESSAKYLTIKKTANPSTMENEETADITYSITITPKEGYIITVSQTSDEITILGENSSNYTFEVDQSQITEQLQPSTEISSPITIQYTLPNVSGTDIALNNTFILDFFVEDDGEIVTDSIKASTTVLIGDPELGCFVFGDAGETVNAINTTTSLEWSNSDKSYVINAYQRILNNTTFMSLLCNDGPITIYKLNSAHIGGYSVGSDTIALYDFNRWNRIQAVVDYTLIHEFGHTISKRNPGLQNDFQANWGGSCFTYNLNYSEGSCLISEAFPEAIVLYEIHSYYNFNSGRYNFPEINPREYSWIEENIYGGGN